MTYALEEKDCPGPVKRFVAGAGYQFGTISNGLQTYTACTTADQACADLAKYLDKTEHIDNDVTLSLSGNMYCGNERLSNKRDWGEKRSTVIDGKGYTITFDKPSGSDIYLFSNVGTLTFKNVKMISRQTTTDEGFSNSICIRTNGVSTRQLAGRNTYYDNRIYFDNVTVEAHATVGYPTTRGTCSFKRIAGGKGGYYDKELGYPEVISGTLNISGFEKSNDGYGAVVKGGTMNYKAQGTGRVSFSFQKGTLNVCADKVLIMSGSICESGTINSSTTDISISDECKKNVTVNYQPDLCDSGIFSGGL